jgi:hypothetical protein
MPASLVTPITNSYARGPPACDTCHKFVEALFERIELVRGTERSTIAVTTVTSRLAGLITLLRLLSRVDLLYKYFPDSYQIPCAYYSPTVTEK